MKKGVLIGIIAAILVTFIGGGVAIALLTNKPSDNGGHKKPKTKHEQAQSGDEDETETTDDVDVKTASVSGYARPTFISAEKGKEVPAYTPSVQPYSTDAELSNCNNSLRISLQDAQREKLAKNNFVVCDDDYDEFFEIYEFNRYGQNPDFITTDSMMHTYHLYYSALQKKTEKNYLFDKVKTMSEAMLAETKNQCETLKGTEWEEAAMMNKAFFSVGVSLINDNSDCVDADVADVALSELSLIAAAGDISTSPLNNDYEDYSQYKPRGYYEGDEQLERYFKTMMWYGRRNFAQKIDVQNRAAMLMSLAMEKTGIADWESVYTVTSFFAGASDDSGFYEYMPLIKAAYGDNVDVSNIAGKDAEYKKYTKLTAQVEAPRINSVPFDDDEGRTDKAEEAKGYRYMGQRVSLDETIFAQLIYSNVKQKSEDDKRMLPDALDLPAALGSEKALSIMRDMGKTDYPNYDEQLQKVGAAVQEMPDLWSGSLYASWINTLNPLLKEKGQGYPSFMTNDEWTKKSLESYLGSWTELKHDSILYAKQVMAEMGGGDEDKYDDRGYVEPEPELYMELRNMTVNTINGLRSYGLLDGADEANLSNLAELAEKLSEISVKELTNELPTDEEFELIRNYGGSIEHLWAEAMKETTGEEYNYVEEHPAALIADVATDPDGMVLEEAIGGLSSIYVVVPVDGVLRVARGCVFNYYQFEQPISAGRISDSEWRLMCGVSITEDYERKTDEHLDEKKPDWTKSYRQNWVYENYYD